MKSSMHMLLCGAALSAVGVSSGAYAQVAPSEQATVVEEVVVTARRREEALKDVPIAVTSQTGEQLERQGASTLADLQRTVPNATFQPSRGTNGTLTAYIRGIGQQDPLWGYEPGVGLYVDDVYIQRPQGAVLDIFDVQRIEVLRGPQGTLYGRNTIGGAIKFVTAPLAPEPALRIRGEVGSYNERNGLIVASTPLSDTFRIGAAIGRYSRDGYGDNLFTGNTTANKDVWTGRISAEWQPTQNFFARFSYDQMLDTSNGNFGHRLLPTLFPADPPNPTSVYDTYGGIGDANTIRTNGGSLTLRYDLNDTWTIKSITAYRAGSTKGAGIDFDGLPTAYLDIGGGYNDHEFTQEFQALYEGERLQGVAGVYYLNGTAAGGYESRLALAAPGGYVNDVIGSVDTSSFAVFGDFSYSLTDRLSISAGGRYTRDEKEGFVFNAQYLGARGPLYGNAAAFLLAIRSNYTNTRDFSRFTPRLSASYQFTPEVTGYLSYSQGFKSGGFDMRGDVIATPATRDGYAPEYVNSYEAGLKGTYFGRRLGLNAAAFYNDYKDRQIATATPTATVPITVVSQVQNAASSVVYGAELEGVWHLVRNPTNTLTLPFSVGYLHSEFKEFLSYNLGTGTYVDISSTQVFEGTPEWTGSAGLNLDHNLGSSGLLSFGVAVTYRSDYSIYQVRNPLIDQAAYTLIDGSVRWASADDSWRVALVGRNLGDERYKTGAYLFPGAVFGNSTNAFYAPPQTFKLIVEHRF